MPKRSRKNPVNDQLSRAMAEAIASGKVPPASDGKNPFAVALGRLGGLKGGKARAANMTAQERSESARRAAELRWSKVDEDGGQ